MNLDLKILKAVLMLRRLGDKYSTKEKQIAEQKELVSERPGYEHIIDKWIDIMRADLCKTQEQREKEHEEWFEEFLEREAQFDYEYDKQYKESYKRDVWDDYWDDVGRSVGAVPDWM